MQVRVERRELDPRRGRLAGVTLGLGGERERAVDVAPVQEIAPWSANARLRSSASPVSRACSTRAIAVSSAPAGSSQ